MDIIIPVLGGLALFLYGMNIMGAGLQKVAGDRLKSIVGSLTRNKYMGVLVGIFVTMIIQSSSATSVMVIGFVNAGIMTLSQAVGVIIGANLGTTVTGQIIAFDINKYAPIAVAIGVLISFLSKTKKTKDISEVLIGFGLLFIGMKTMSSGLAPLSKQPWFSEAIIKLNNPFVGVPVGIGLTTIVQSSSASIGLLEALGKQGLITINQAFPILFGDNIGTTTTALISSIGANKNAKRTAIIHFLFNLIGTIIFMTILRYPIQILVEYISPGNTARQIANAHTFFNLINVIIQLPFSALLVKAANLLVPGEDDKSETASKYLDNRILETPSIAIVQVKKEVVRMGQIVANSLNMINDVFVSKNRDTIQKIYDNEKTINILEKEIVEYLVELSKRNISSDENTQLFIMQDMVNDLERVGDHIENINELVETSISEDNYFSELAKTEFLNMMRKTMTIYEKSMSSFENNDEQMASESIVLEEVIDALEKEYRHNHIRRINKGECNPDVGVKFLDILSNLERISDHSLNISNYVLHIEV